MKTRLPEFDPEIAPADSKQFSPTGTNLKKRFPIRNATAWLRLRTTRAMRLLPLLLLLALPAVVLAQYPYTTHNGTTPITGYSGPGGEVTIPSTLDRLPVILGSMPGTWPSALAANDPFISTQPTNQSRDVGQSGYFRVVAGGTEPLYYQWIKDGLALANGTNVTGVTNSMLTINRLIETDAGDYTVVVGNPYGSLTSVVARMDLNLSFADASYNPGAGGNAACLAIQADGRILVGGSFSALGGQSRANIGRLNVDGTLDSTFNPGVVGYVNCLAVQADGKIVVGGYFSTLGGQSRTNIGRLNVDGTVDDTFNPSTYGSVTCLAVQADGRIVVGGGFFNLGGQWGRGLGRLNVDGTVDGTFNLGVDSYVKCLTVAVQADGKIVFGGSFATLGGQSRSNIGRLNVDGTVDSTFNPGAYSLVACLAIQADGKIVVGGAVTTLDGQSRQFIGRLNVDGTIDTTFNPGVNWLVNCLAIQADGKTVVAGSFATLGGQSRSNIGRLNVDGTVDSTFNPGASDEVTSLAIQADGKMVMGGKFSAMGGQPRSFIGRLNSTGLATQQLSFDKTTVVWLRGGSSPEVSRVTFDYSTNGASWTPLGNGARVPGGWQLTGLSLSTSQTIRARGAAVSGGISDWSVEQAIGAPIITFQPVSIAKNFGSNAYFTATSSGSEPLQYQWLKDGRALTNSGNLSGVTTDRLTMTQLSKTDTGGYSVVVGNVFGSVTSLVASLTVSDPFIANQPTNQYRELGQTGSFSVVAGGIEPLYYQWFKDGLALANGTKVTGVTNSWLTINPLLETDVGDYTVVVGNQYGSVTSVVARMDLNLITVDASFNPGASGGIDCLAFQSDGKVLVGGGFLSLGGQSRTNIGRLNVDGTVDAAFHPGAAGVVICLAVQADRKIVLGGEFITLGGQSRAYIGRLNVDGTVDSTFNPGASWSVTCLAIQADGKVVVGGFFSSLGGQSRQYLGRLNVDGTVDSTFNPGANDSVACLAIQADGNLIVGGSFSSLGGQTRQFLGRLNVDGSVDNGFNPGANGPVSCLAMQADGKLIIGGNFTSLGGQSRQNLGRLNVDGSVDSTFNSGASGPVSCLGIQTDGKIVVGGNFSSLGGQLRQNLGRLNVNGTVDSTFSPGASDIVYCQAIQADGRIVVAGNFSALGGQSRSFIGRLNNTGPATQQLSFEETTVVWLRGGSSPEFSRVTFDYSTHGASWIPLGNGDRVPGGWQLTGLSLATNRTIRATGAAVGGGKSDWTVEQVAGAPIIAIQPESIVNNFGSNVSFSVTSYGSPPMQYQWLKGGVTLTNSGNLSGVTTDRLTMTQLSKADEDGYSVLVGNAFGSVTSLVASLTVNDPFITTQPINQLRELGQSGSFSVVAGGTSPVYHRWFKDGVALENGTNTTGVTTSSLTINKLMTTDAGDYWAVVSNQNGSVTSVVATVLLNLCTPDTGFNPVANDLVTSLAIQADGKIIVGGNFTTLGGQKRQRIGRLNTDGTIDSIFNPGANSFVTCLAIQTDEKIVVGGSFTSLGGQVRAFIGRLNRDGTVDSGFNPGANNYVNCLAIQPDGKIVVGGYFKVMGGQSRTNIARLNLDGSLDNGFNPGANNYVNCLAIQPDGKIVVGGYFKVMGGQSRTNIARLNPDGSLDNEFNPGANSYVYCLAIQADGKIVAGGNFTTLNGQASKNIARLNPDGSVDSGFNAAGGGEVDCLAIQADGKIVVGGSFGSLGGQYHPSIGRLNVDGSADNTFRPSARGSTIYCLAIQADGKVIVGGSMNSLSDLPCKNIARLNDAEPATQQLSYDGSTVTWLRGGTGPDVWRATFECATNGLDWTLIGNGARVPGGWQLSGVSIPTNAMIRARGSAITGGVSDWFVETTIGSTSPAMSLNIDRLGAGPVLRVTGGIGLQYHLEYTPGLSATHVWQSMPFTLTNSPQIIIDETMTNANQRYYRLRTN